MATTKKEDSIITALRDIQSKLKAPKNQRNTFGGYNYRSLEDITEAVKPLLEENNCVLTFEDGLEQIGDRYYVCATATLRNETESISTTARAREPLAKKGMDESQITGTASSYARKYAANGLFAIDDTKDADTDEHHKEVESRPAQKNAPKSAPIKAESTSNSKQSTDSEEVADALERKKYRQLIVQYAREHKMTMSEIENDHHVTNDSPLDELKRAYKELTTPPEEQASIADEFAAIDEDVPF